MTTQTHTGGYLKKMAQGGHFKQKLGETALALTECFCKADDGNKRRLGNHLASEMERILRDVYGWNKADANRAAAELRKAFQATDDQWRAQP